MSKQALRSTELLKKSVNSRVKLSKNKERVYTSWSTVDAIYQRVDSRLSLPLSKSFALGWGLSGGVCGAGSNRWVGRPFGNNDISLGLVGWDEWSGVKTSPLDGQTPRITVSNTTRNWSSVGRGSYFNTHNFQTIGFQPTSYPKETCVSEVCTTPTV